ncbi:MAG: acyl-CoA dehydrogenase family protein [Candidatus Thorarchaeota archaeon]
MEQVEGDRNNPYNFNDYIFVRDNFNFYKDDEFLQALVKTFVPENEYESIHHDLWALSDVVSFKWRKLADIAAEIDNRAKVTRIKHFDAFNHRIDRIERCAETETLEKEIFSLGLFDPIRNSAWSRFVKMFLLYENGESGVMCPVACTHGLYELLRKYESSLSPEALSILNSVRYGKGYNSNGEYGRGAQFVSEIQGGSDVPANLVEANYETSEGTDGLSNCWRIYGQKFFCSAAHTDFALITAKPKGTDSSTRVAAFAVPSWLSGNKGKEIRNSYTIDRLKPKLGTAELPTAEITFNGAVAYPIGPLEKGLADVVGIVLSLSRLHVAFGLAAGALRVVREAILYAQFRTAFGVPVASYPLMINQINELNQFAKRTAAGVFKVYSEYIHFNEELISGIRDLEQIEDVEERKRRFRLRELIMLQKIVVADEAPAMVRLAISFFGGHGIMEDFLSLPRFHRDAMIMELWEGPRNLLLTQIHRDFQRVARWYSADQFVRDLLENSDEDLINNYSEKFTNIIKHETLLRNDEITLKVSNDWQQFSNELFKAFQEQALREVNFTEKPLKFSKLHREFKKRESESM